MEKKDNILKTLGLGKFLSVCLMLFCLTFLTSANFFMYGDDADTSCAYLNAGAEDAENDYPPTGPTEEKSSSSSITINEEILHETHPEFNFGRMDHLYLHHIAEAEKIEMFHPELILPPPKF